MAVDSSAPYANHLHLAPGSKLCQHLITQFLQADSSSCRPTNSVKALKAMGQSPVGSLTSLKDVGIVQQIDAIYPQPSSECKPKRQSIVITAQLYVYRCAQQSYTIQHRTAVITFSLILHTVIITQMLSMLSTGGEGNDKLVYIATSGHTTHAIP